jgi:hypothetical protein
MKTVSCWQDLEPYGFVTLTGEACGLMYRILFDLTAAGRNAVQKCLGVPDLRLADAWNRGDAGDPHVGSIMLSPEMFVPLAVFALLEAGCTECWLYANRSLLGVEAGESAERVEACRQMAPEQRVRKLRYGGRAGDRNFHLMTGRVA